MDTILERKELLHQQLSAIKDKDERLRYIVDQGKSLPPLPDQLKLDQFVVKGCISKAWLIPQIQSEKLSFLADSEAVIVKGIIALILKVYNGSSPQEILDLSPDFLAEAGVTELLSMNRRSGLIHVLAMIRNYAERMQTQP
jgi:cysteine desulfuration protein SufE